VNRRLEAHKSRRGIAMVAPVAPAEQSAANDRAAQVAARVAARFAKAPSFSEMQAAEARAALRAAEEATRKALEAQAAAQAALASLAASEELQEELMAPEEEPEAVATEPAELEAPVVVSEVRWEPEMPVRPAAPLERAEEHTAVESWTDEPEPTAATPIETVEGAQTIPANLIQFPRELVATRRMRPRITGAPEGESGDLFGQLSIFEVDPGMVSTEPEPAAAVEAAPMHSWTEPGWQSLELDAHPEVEFEPEEETQAAPHAPQIELAPLGLRMLATVVDLTLIAGMASGAAWWGLHHVAALPQLRTAELMGAALLLVMGLVYHAATLMAFGVTPGMKYAGIALCTFNDEIPERAQLRERLVAILVSLLPVGLGLAWAAFDENHLSWHDRLSRTYLRKC